MSRRAIWAAVVTLFAGFVGLAGYRVAMPHVQPPRAIGGPFTLIDGTGATRTDREFRGRFVLVYFGYTNCPDVCPTTLAAVGDAMVALGAEAKQVKPIFITVDPARDSPEIVGRYAAQFSPDLLGLTGTPEAIAMVAKSFRVYLPPHRDGPGQPDYTVDHSSILYLLGPDGRFLEPVDASLDGADLAAKLRAAMRVAA